jgi:dihydrofolate reductase / thymidylate synthase
MATSNIPSAEYFILPELNSSLPDINVIQTTNKNPTNTTTYNYSIIVAHSIPEYGIGIQNSMPWYIPDDLKHFREITTKSLQDTINIVVMGRKTYQSIPQHIKPLNKRYTIIISRNQENNNKQNKINTTLHEYWTTWEQLDNVLNILRHNPNTTNQVIFCGGAQIYDLALNKYNITRAHITEVYLHKKNNESAFHTFFPKYKLHNFIVNNTNNINLENNQKLFLNDVSLFKTYYDKNTNRNIYFRYKTYLSNSELISSNALPWHLCCEEQTQYIAIMNDIISKGIERSDRTGTGTLSLFGTRQHYDLRDTFPLSTTKRIFFRAVFEELKLYLSGRTDNAILQEQGIHIWDGNTSREFLDGRGLQHYPEGDMGETYGFNFRHFAGDYKDCHTEYSLDGSNGYDQLANVIHLLKNEPTSRRIIINLWNPATLHKAALPSCLMLYQFYVDTHAKLLHCQIYIRSSDYFLANNWNTCTGALLVHMLCALEDINLTPGSITTITGDTHLYKTHLEQVNKNLEREPVPFPKLVIENTKTESRKFKKIEDIQFEDLQLWGYMPQPNISAPMAV